MRVVVFGSINMDLVARTPRLPGPGETLTGHGFFTTPGGKGANQAVASARAGAPTVMVGRVGQDVFGAELRTSLERYGVDTSGVLTSPGASGVAQIAVDDRAENTIIIVAGANGLIGAEDIARLEPLLDTASVVLLQLEVPLDSVVAAAQAARRRGVTVILDPAPAQMLPAALYQAVDIITPNEHEAGMLTQRTIQSRADAEAAARDLVARGVRTAIVKLGARGAICFDGTTMHHLPVFPVTPVDSVAAGDAFNGGLAAALNQQQPLAEALRWGMACGALSVTRPGAQQAMPDRAEILALVTTGHDSDAG